MPTLDGLTHSNQHSRSTTLHTTTAPTTFLPTTINPTILAFFLLGLLNNTPYVIMLASANSISASAVGYVYLAAIAPAALVKLSSPLWFHHVSYSIRIKACAFFMAIAFIIVGLCTSSRAWQLLGVAAASLQSGLGEASCLAMTVLYGGRPAITAWSSGTGLAGIAGYAWVFILHYKVGLSFTMTLLLAQIHVVLWLATYFKYLLKSDAKKERRTGVIVVDNSVVDNIDNNNNNGDQETTGLLPPSIPSSSSSSSIPSSSISTLTVTEKVQLVTSLWPYMIPLFVVYFAEYAMQSGTWAAIGFPLHEKHARHQFYVLANWCYQAGVFLSRSAGMMWNASLTTIWIMPVAQLGFLLFFILNAVVQFWWNWGLLLPCFVTGLLGGSVYVQGFSAIARDVLPGHREFALAAASVADSFGVALADVVGVLIQGCLFKLNGLEDADFSC